MANLYASVGPWVDSNGTPLNGGLIYTYVTNSTTPKATYTDSSENTAAANPIVLDTSGCAVIYLKTDAAYRFVVKTSSGTTVRTIDNITPVVAFAAQSGGSNIDISGYAIVTQTGQNLTLTPGSGGHITAGVFSLPTTTGSANQVLTSSGTGTTTWGSPSGSLQLDTSPKLGGTLNTNGFNIIIDNGGGFIDENGNNQLIFTTTASAVNYLTHANAAASGAVVIGTAGSDSSVGLTVTTKNNGVTTISGPLTSSGAFIASSTAAITGNTTVGGTLGVTGATTLSSTLGVTGNTTLTGTCTINGASTALTVANNASVGGTLSVTGASTLTGNTTVGGTFGVTGATTLHASTIGGTTFPSSAGTDTYILQTSSSTASWVNPNTVGRLVLISSQTASSSASISFTGLGNTYSSYYLIIAGLKMSTNGAYLRGQISTNNGSTWVAGASDYLSGYVADGYAGYSNILKNVSSTYPAMIFGHLYGMGTSTYPILTCSCGGIDSGSSFNNLIGCMAYAGNTSGILTANAIKFLPSSGNFATGTFALYGVA